LGWVPKEFINGKLGAYEITDELIAPAKPSTVPSTAATSKGTSSQPFPFFSIILLLWLLPLFRRRKRARKPSKGQGS